jgi:hypothetical protein
LEDAEWPKIAQLYHFMEGVGGGEGVARRGQEEREVRILY